MAIYRFELGTSMVARFQHTGTLADVSEAIDLLKQAVSCFSDSDLGKHNLLPDLGVALISRFERTGHVADIDEAIKTHSQANEILPDDHTAKPGALSGLGNALMLRFQRLGQVGGSICCPGCVRRIDSGRDSG
jgi:hypothetical protein